MAKKRAASRPPGTRGPIKGKGGRPAAARKKATRQKKPAPRSAAGLALFAESLSALTFADLVEHAGRFRELQSQDHELLVLLWDSLRLYRRVTEQLDKGELIQVYESGAEGPAALFAVRKQLVRDIADLSARFAMSPADRARLGEAPADKESASPFADHMKKVQALSGEVESAQAARKRR